MCNTIKDKEKKILSYIWPNKFEKLGIINYKQK